MRGRIERGVADRIKTVLWFSDLRNYTRISETSAPEEIIPLLNDYAEAVVSSIHQHSGDVLKPIGDWVLAIFPAEERSRACAAALDAGRGGAGGGGGSERAPVRKGPSSERHVSRAPHRRGFLRQHREQGAPRFHRRRAGGQRGEPYSGDVPVGRPADPHLGVVRGNPAPEERRAFASVGRFALRGVGKPQELFTLDLEGSLVG